MHCCILYCFDSGWFYLYPTLLGVGQLDRYMGKYIMLTHKQLGIIFQM